MALSEPGTFGSLIGNEALTTRLYRELNTGTLSHAYLLEGAHGSGRRTLALELCAALACSERTGGGHLPCGHCPSCEKILGGKSPDVVFISRGGKASIGVDDVRFLRSDVLIEPNDLDNKIYIIEDAETMTAQAQNALLLTLEEPPLYVLFLLICADASALLETVRSRVQPLRLLPVGDREMREYLRDTSPTFRALSEHDAAEVLLLSGGSVGRALELLDPKERVPITERRALARSFVEAKLRGGGAAELLQLTGKFGTKREEISEILTDARTALRDLLLLKKSEDAPLCFYTDRGAAATLAGQIRAGAIVALTESLDRTFRQLARNANVRLILTKLALG